MSYQWCKPDPTFRLPCCLVQPSDCGTKLRIVAIEFGVCTIVAAVRPGISEPIIEIGSVDLLLGECEAVMVSVLAMQLDLDMRSHSQYTSHMLYTLGYY